jgi:Flp pilus assembly pilin Flp
MAVLDAVAAVTILSTIGTTASGMYNKVNNSFSQS